MRSIKAMRSVAAIGAILVHWHAAVASGLSQAASPGTHPARPGAQADRASGGVAVCSPSDDAAGLMEGSLRYGRAWVRGDFLVRVRYSFDSINRIVAGRKDLNPDGILVEKTEFYRVGFDYERCCFCVLWHKEHSVLDLSRQRDGLLPRSRVEDDFGGCVDSKGVSRWRNFPSEAMERPDARPSIEKATAQIGFPDFRGIAFAELFSPAGFSNAQKIVAQYRHHEVHSVVEDKDGIVRVVYFFPGASGSADILTTWNFDPERLVPVSCHVLAREGRIPGLRKEYDAGESSYIWSERNGIQVPLEIHRHSDCASEFVHHTMHYGTEFTDLEFHWFSLNEDVDPKLFDGSCLKDLDTLRGMILPSRNGAITLLDGEPAPADPGEARPDR